MTRIISVVNQKGGVGKTTTAINLAGSIAQLGYRVLLIDVDPQGNATSGLGVEVQDNQPSIYDVFLQQAMIQETLFSTAIEGLDIAPATVDLAGATVELVQEEDREYRLDRAVESIKQEYDFIFIDCPPTLGVLTINGIVASREVLIPVQAEYYALEGLSQLLRTIALIQEHLQPALQVLGAVVTMYDRRNRLAQSVYRDLYSHFPYKLFRTTIDRTVKLAEAPSYGKSIIEYAPLSNGARSYKRLAKELIESEIPTIQEADTAEEIHIQHAPTPAPVDDVIPQSSFSSSIDSTVNENHYG